MAAETSIEKKPTGAKAWLALGQKEELAGHFEAAVDAFDQAIACHARETTEYQPEKIYDLAVAWMNRGNALQKQSGVAAFEESARSYQQTIELLGALKILEEKPRLTLGCAWMNRGSALLKQGRMAEAVAANKMAIEVLTILPSIASDSHSRTMLAAAWMNCGEGMFRLGVDIGAARRAAQKALALVGAREAVESTALEIALKARCILCEIFGVKMRLGGAEKVLIAAEASDIAEDALASLRAWAQKTGNLPHAPLAVWFFQYGSACYADFQPHFLAAFLKDNLDVVAEPAFSAVAAEFRRIAQASVASTRTRLHSLLFAEPSSADAERWLTALRSFETIAGRLELSV